MIHSHSNSFFIFDIVMGTTERLDRNEHITDMSLFVVMPPTRTHGCRVFAIPCLYVHKTEELKTIRYFDIDQRKWVSTKKTLPWDRSFAVARLTDTTFVMCGYDRDYNTPQAGCALFDTDTYEVTQLPDMAAPRAYFNAIHYRGMVVVVGGNDDTVDMIKMCEQYTPGAVAWEPMAEIPARVRRWPDRITRTAVVNDEIYVLHGRTAPDSFVYDGTTWREIAVGGWYDDIFECFLFNYKGTPAILRRCGKIQLLDMEAGVWRQLDDIAEPVYWSMPALGIYTF